MIATSTEEQDRPLEWLSRLQDAGAYGALVEDAGSLALAAHRLAAAVCRARSVPTELPTLSELQVAARTITLACGLPAPTARAMLQACALAGCLVIEPIERAPAPRSMAPRWIDGDASGYAY